jgi:hypothetical protein
MDDHKDDDSTTTPKRVIALALFLILFGIAFGILTVATLVGPVFGLLMVGFGVYLVWKSAQGRPPETLP